ncbi:MAG TPA: hypothetical protein VHW43_02200 [Puia sp.]|nr:hypothetical protein [Puia sp.]
MDIQVQNLYEIDNVVGFVNEHNMIVLPEKSIISLLDLSISHTRALLAKNAAGTVYQDSPMPVFDAENAAQLFFPYMFYPDTAMEDITKEAD